MRSIKTLADVYADANGSVSIELHRRGIELHPDGREEESEQLLDLYALLVFTTGLDTTPGHVLSAYRLWRAATVPDDRGVSEYCGELPSDIDYAARICEAVKACATKHRPGLLNLLPAS